METQEIKQKIKDYFVEIKEDKFTKIKSIKCKHKIQWSGKELENKFMLTKDSTSINFSMSIDYRHKDDIDSIFLKFIYSNTDGGYPEMSDIKMYLILDDDKTIELSDASGFDHASQSSKIGDKFINVYIESAQLAVTMSDFIAIANANKIEYSIRFGQGSLENVFKKNDLLVLKGFYNSAFDEEFEFESLKKVALGIERLLDKNSIEFKIIELCEKGQKLAACKLYKNHSGSNLFKANEFVEKLCTDYNVTVQSSSEEDKFKKEKISLVDKYSIANNDLKLLSEIEEQKSNLGLFSFKKEGLKAQSLKILKPYKVSFMDLGLLLNEIKAGEFHKK